MKIILFTSLFLFILQICNAQTASIDYFGQTPPGDTAVVFAPGIISRTDRLEAKMAFAPDGSECYFEVVEIKDNKASYKIYYSKRVNNIWTGQVEAPFSVNNNVGSPVFSVNGKELYFTKYSTDETTSDIWMVERTTEGWGEPQLLPAPINSISHELGYTETADSVIYFDSDRPGGYGGFDIWCKRPSSDKAENLGSILNSNLYDSDPCIAPDGSYLIFSSERYQSAGGNLLCISFKKGNNGWTAPVNMNSSGAKINNNIAHHGSPSLSPDGKYLFFFRHSDLTVMDVHWVSTHVLIGLKKAVFAPKLSNQIPNVSIKADTVFNYVVPSNTFSCEFGTDSLQYSASLSNGSALPSWLTFNAGTRTLSGTPRQGEIDTIKITATNKDTVSATCSFRITVTKQIQFDYFGQTPPQDTPIKFPALPSGSSLVLHSAPSFSPSGDESFFATIPDFNTYTQSIYYRKRENGQWLDPVKVSFSNGTYSDKLPCFSGDGKRVYFTSDRPLTGSGNPIDENVWYIEKNTASWSDPICLDNSVNTSQHEGWITVAANNNLYFCRNNILYLATWQNDHYLPAQVLPIYNSASGVLGAIAPDESYYIVQSEYVQNSSGSWIDDLYILTKTNGDWGTPVKLDSKINSMKSKSFAKISLDGKYLFFLGDNNDAYWVSTEFTKSLTGVEKTHNSELPSTMKLRQNYPNPFNPSTVISYQLSVSSNVNLKIYDTLGREVRSLVDSYQSAGEHSVTWNGTNNSNNPVCSGVYFYKMETNGSSFQKKMTLVR